MGFNATRRYRDGKGTDIALLVVHHTGRVAGDAST